MSGDSNGTDDIFEYNRLTGDNTLVSVKSNGDQLSSNSGVDYPVVSDDGRFIAFHTFGSSGYLDSHLVTSEGADFIHDMRDGSTPAIALRSTDSYALGGSAPAMSADGTITAFNTGSSDLIPGANSGNIFSSKTGF